MTDEPSPFAPPPGSDFYYATRYLDASIRRALWPLEVFRAEISRIPVNCSDAGVARVKLAWWREEISRFGHGEARHPVTRALSAPVFSGISLATVLIEAVEAIDGSFTADQASTRTAYFERLGAIHGGLWQIYARLCGACDDETIARVRELGCHIEHGYNIRDLRDLIGTGLSPLAIETLREYELRAEELRAPGARERTAAMFTRMTRAALDQIRAAAAAIPQRQRPAQSVALVLARIVTATLTELARDGCHLLERRIELTPLRKLWIAWRVKAEAH